MKKIIAALVLTALFTPLAARAESISPVMGTYYTTATVNIAAPSALSSNIYIGQMTVNWQGAAYQAYCVDLFTDFNLGDTWTPVERRMAELPIVTSGVSNPPYATAGTGEAAAWLVNAHAASIGSARDAAALQLAIWLTLYNNLPTAGFTFASDTDYIRNTAATWANAAYGQHGDAVWLDFQGAAGLTHGQDLVLPNTVPEPASMLLFGTGLMGLAGIARRKLRR